MRAWFAKVSMWFFGLATSEKIAVAAIVIPIITSMIAGLLSLLFSKQVEPSVTDDSIKISAETIVIKVDGYQPNAEFSDSERVSHYTELNIAGVILNESGEPVSNVVVEIPSYHIRSEPSDEMGKFSIYRDGDTDSRDAEVFVKINSYYTNHDTIDLNDKNIEIKMRKKGF